MTAPAVIVVLSEGALDTARSIQARLPGAHVHGLRARVQVEFAFEELGAHLRELYARGTPIVALCAAGIVIRCLAPALGNKGGEPPVLAVAEDGSAVVPLLGGLAGVNAMARDIAQALGVAPAITTSGELRFGTCLLSPPDGYALASLEQGKHFVSDLLAGRTMRIEGNAPWIEAANLPVDACAPLTINVTPQAGDETRRDELRIHPRCVVAAVDEAARDTAETAAQRVVAALGAHGLALQSLAALVAPADRMGEPGLERAAATLGVSLRFVDWQIDGGSTIAITPWGSPPDTCRDVPLGTHLNAPLNARLNAPLNVQPNAHPTISSAGPTLTSTGARLLAAALPVPYTLLAHRSGIALGVASAPVDVASIGRARGRLVVVGLGPGCAELMAPAGRTALAEASDVVGYETYLSMAGPFRKDQRVHGSDNREELQRARHAFELASEGRTVAVVSSGDPGVFAMAAAVLEALDSADDPRWRQVELRIVPGISAAMATAAEAGAPLGHDFCVLSLSDNLKPWAVIEKRLRHAAEADLVMAFYNPVSRARPWQLDRALDIVRAHRHGETRVVLGRDIGRPGATLSTTTLALLRTDQVDMRTTVIIGSSTTRGVPGAPHGEWIYTPRWYQG